VVRFALTIYPYSLEEFAEKYPKEVGIPITCNVRANLMCNEKMGKLLKQMDCRNAYMGVECGNNEVASTLLKRNLSNEQTVKSCEILHKYKIQIMTQNLIGLPVENPLEVDLETLDFNIKLRPNFAWSSILYPYPSTELGQLAMQKGMFHANFEKVSVSNKTDSVLDFDDPKLKRQIVNLHKLFGLIVQFSFLRPLTLLLISLPLTPFYTWVFFAMYGYKILRQSSTQGLFNALRYYIPFYFKYVSQLEKRKEFRKQSYPNVE